MTVEQVGTIEQELKAKRTALEQAERSRRAAIVANSGIAAAQDIVNALAADVGLLEQTILGIKERQEDQHTAIVEQNTQEQHDRCIRSIEALTRAVMKGGPVLASVGTWVNSVIAAADGTSRENASDITQQAFATRLTAARVLELYALQLKTGNPTIQGELTRMMTRLEKGLPTVDQV